MQRHASQRTLPPAPGPTITIVDLKPLGSLAEAHYALATILALNQRWDEAERALRASFELEPCRALDALNAPAFRRLRSRARFRRSLHKSLVQAGLL